MEIGLIAVTYRRASFTLFSTATLLRTHMQVCCVTYCISVVYCKGGYCCIFGITTKLLTQHGSCSRKSAYWQLARQLASSAETGIKVCFLAYAAGICQQYYTVEHCHSCAHPCASMLRHLLSFCGMFAL